MATRTPKIPDTRTRQKTARNVVARLNELQDARERIELKQFTEEAKDTDQISGLPPKTDDGGEPIIEDGKLVFLTYGEVYIENTAGQERAWLWAREKNCDKLVTKMIEADQEADSE